MTDVSISTTIGDIVARDLRAAAVFARHGIDFCCGGRRSIEDACRAGGIDPNQLVNELAELEPVHDGAEDVSRWPADRVIDRIVNGHHAYVRRQIPVIDGYLATLVDKKGARHPELCRIREIFHGFARELVHHMEKEETILFPYISAMAAARPDCIRAPQSPFGTIRNPIRMMEAEHQQAAADMWLLRTLTDGFQPPADACATWRACYADLAAFERDLHEHVHLENNVLFTAAARMEEELA
jgi:regulator of cell morphogenesis and NO signaling